MIDLVSLTASHRHVKIAAVVSPWSGRAVTGRIPAVRLLVVATVCTFFVVAMDSSAGQASGAEATWKVLALGDSDTTGAGDATGLGWVGRYARLVRQRFGAKVTVTNLAQEGQTSTQLLSAVRSDSSTRKALTAAQIVLLGIGGADLNSGDARWEAGKCEAEACYASDLKAFARNFEATAAEIRKLATRRSVVRAITLPNGLTGAESVIPEFLAPVATRIGVFQATKLKTSICSSMSRHRGRCIDVLHAFNGPDGTANAYAKGFMNLDQCCYPSGKGQQLMAQLLLQTGVSPLR